MFLVQFVRRDGKPNEEYYYHSKQSAVDHLNLFYNDDSKIYQYIKLFRVNKAQNILIKSIEFCCWFEAANIGGFFENYIDLIEIYTKSWYNQWDNMKGR